MAFQKLITIALLVSLLVASVTAQFYDNPQERCMREAKECSLRSCKRFMKSGRGLLLSMTNQGMRERCCRELRMVSPQCRCDVIKEMMSDMQEEMEGERYGGGMSRRMMDMAEKLPSMCHMSPGYCHLRERY
ncbi:hypothetical protein LUZ60_001376 [Juncus effusus]|nr:hypothetical protein LUZ60_001376 [Juncus effusus]